MYQLFAHGIDYTPDDFFRPPFPAHLRTAMDSLCVWLLERWAAAGRSLDAPILDGRSHILLYVIELRLGNSLDDLLSQDIDVRVADIDGFTALHLLCQRSRFISGSGVQSLTACVKRLVDLGADVHACTRSGGWTPMHCAAANTGRDAIESILKAGGDMDAVTPDGVTPHFIAATHWSTILQKRIALVKRIDWTLPVYLPATVLPVMRKWSVPPASMLTALR